MGKYKIVGKPVKTTEEEWDRIFNSPVVLAIKFQVGAIRGERMVGDRQGHPLPSLPMRQIEYADLCKDPAFGPLGFSEDGKGLPSVYNQITGEWCEVLNVKEERKEQPLGDLSCAARPREEPKV